MLGVDMEGIIALTFYCKIEFVVGLGWEFREKAFRQYPCHAFIIEPLARIDDYKLRRRAWKRYLRQFPFDSCKKGIQRIADEVGFKIK